MKAQSKCGSPPALTGTTACTPVVPIPCSTTAPQTVTTSPSCNPARVSYMLAAQSETSGKALTVSGRIPELGRQDNGTISSIHSPSPTTTCSSTWMVCYWPSLTRDITGCRHLQLTTSTLAPIRGQVWPTISLTR